jgi:hypothetical protein
VPLISRRPKPQLAQMNRIDKHIQWSLVLQSYFALLMGNKQQQRRMASPSADYVLHLRAVGDRADDYDVAGQRCIYAVDCSIPHIRNVETRGSTARCLSTALVVFMIIVAAPPEACIIAPIYRYYIVAAAFVECSSVTSTGSLQCREWQLTALHVSHLDRLLHFPAKP